MIGLASIFLSRTALEVYAVIALGLFLLGLKHGYDERRRDEGRAEIQAKWDLDKAARVKAFSDMTTKWITASVDAEKAIKERDDARNAKFTGARQKAASLPESLAAMPVPFQSVVVLDDAIRDSAAAAGTTPKPNEAAAGTPKGSNIGLLTEWGVECIAYYDAAKQRVADWESFYQSLRDKQGKPETP